MGEMSDMMLDGTLCMECGQLLASPSEEDPNVLEPLGYPAKCESCARMRLDKEPDESSTDYLRRVKEEIRNWCRDQAASAFVEMTGEVEVQLRETIKETDAEIAKYGANEAAARIEESEQAEILRWADVCAATTVLRTLLEVRSIHALGEKAERQLLDALIEEISGACAESFPKLRLEARIVEAPSALDKDAGTR